MRPGVAEGVNLLPEIAPRLGIDPGGGLVQQQQLGIVQGAGRQRHALLPAARQLPGKLVLARLQAQPFQRGLHLAPPVLDAIDPRHEIQILADR